MCAQYILDSILYWTEEYHIDGFRFDLMGLLDVDLMTRIQNELDKRYGVGEKLVYGEPWSADTSATRPDTMLCNKPHMKDVHPAVGSFCDDTRDAVKGNLMNPGTVGFVNGGPISADKVRPCIRGWVRSEGGPAKTPMQTVTYLSCHDDWTLWDKLVYTMDPEKKFTSSQPEILRANRMAAAMNFCCQGHVFFLSGEEYARTKGGVKNSYCSSTEINLLDWNRAWENKELVDYYRGLIGLRMQLPCLQDKTARAAQHLLTCVDLAPNFVGVSLANDTALSPWDKIILLFNADHEEHILHLPADETWQTLVDADSSLLWKAPAALTDNEAVVAPVSAMILGRVTK